MMLQDIYPHKLFNQYDPSAAPADNDSVLIVQGRNIVAEISGRNIEYPRVSELADDKLREKLIYLFSVDDERYFGLVTENIVREENPDKILELMHKEGIAEPSGAEKYGFTDKEGIAESSGTEKYGFTDKEGIAEPSGAEKYGFTELKELRESDCGPKYRIYAAYTAKHLLDWYRDMRFCGRCGDKMEHSKTERAMCCPSCKYTAYPRIMPAVIAGVVNGDKILLTKYRTGYNHNAMIAGFVEIGETVEETVQREVMEEAGVKVKNIRYYKSQPWGIAGDVLMGYFCDVDGDDTIHMDNNELKSAEWTSREDIVLQPDSSSLTNEMMKLFKDGEKV